MKSSRSGGNGKLNNGRTKKMNKTLRPSDESVEKICVDCLKPVMVPLKTLKLKWGKQDWRHRMCYLKHRKYNKLENFDEFAW